jgi:hypothetical protein
MHSYGLYVSELIPEKDYKNFHVLSIMPFKGRG